MGLSPASDAFGSFAARHGLGEQLGATRVVACANTVAGGRFQALSFRAGRLTVAVALPEDRYLLQPDLPQLIDAVNKKLGRPLVREIRFRLQN